MAPQTCIEQGNKSKEYGAHMTHDDDKWIPPSLTEEIIKNFLIPPSLVLYASSGQKKPAQGRTGITLVAIFGEQGRAGH